MSVAFNSIPGSGLVAPLMTMEVNSGGSPYDGRSRLLLLGHKISAGNGADGSLYPVASQLEANTRWGAGSQLAQMYRIARANAPTAEIWAASVTDTGTAQTWTLTVGALPGKAGVGIIEIAGERLQVTIGASDTAAIVATSLAAAINAYVDLNTGAMLPVTAAAATNVVTVTARHLGALFGELDFWTGTSAASNIFGGGVLTIATSTAGAGTPSVSAVLAAMGDEEYDLIVNPWSDSANLAAIQTALDDVSGRWAFNRQIYGHMLYPFVGTFSAQTTHGLARNDRHSTALAVLPSPTPSWLWAAGFAARVFPWLSDGVTGGVSRNQTGLAVSGVKPPRGSSQRWNYAARNTLNGSGMSTWTADKAGTVKVDKLVTTYQLGPLGQPDATFRDIQAMFQLTYGLRYLRIEMANEHGQKAIANDNPGALQAISTPKEIKATLVHAHLQLCRQGVFENNQRFAESIIVERNAGNANRVDFFLPLDRVNPLDILAANATLYSQYAA
ncbi:phage tail sheath subtilisin-like domain-containing protein [Labrys wisconsinensis]|uniref:Phage tail sheath gpL-like n=1 Tax=Labrys wisconsinensis TaxID=425677 RepID=A0ABU0JGV2_9HYPH|nr:phage tail sheath subtilisin-like domain-containing protein [Labrys wisconsinensis]MDQ0472815.1 phage tail sheath gpL-like [Labrys wisconsinensis]